MKDRGFIEHVSNVDDHDKIEGVVRGNLRALRASLAEHTDRREVFGAMFDDWSQLRVVAHAG